MSNHPCLQTLNHVDSDMLHLCLVSIISNLKFKVCDDFCCKDDRPVYPYRITGTEVLLNPFDDIVPRAAISNEVDSSRKSSKKGVK